jgi:hypothetical protein
MDISIDNTQKETLNSIWHCDQPSFLTAAGDSYEELFPVDALLMMWLRISLLKIMAQKQRLHQKRLIYSISHVKW